MTFVSPQLPATDCYTTLNDQSDPHCPAIVGARVTAQR